MSSTISNIPHQLPVMPDLATMPIKEAGRANASHIDPTQFVASPQSESTLLQRGLTPPAPVAQASSSTVTGAMAALQGLDETAQADIFKLMALFTEIAQEQRNAARQGREGALQAEVQTMLGAAGKIREAAEDRFNAQIALAVAQVVSGVISMVAGAASAVAGAKAMNNASGTTSQMDPQQANTMATIFNSLGQGGSTITTSAGTATEATFNLQAGEKDAEGAEMNAQAKRLEAGRDEENEIMQQMFQLIQDVIGKLAAIEQSRADTARGLARNI